MFCTSSPNSPAPRIISARLAAANKAFDGMQPVLRQSPPILRRSISTVGTPNAAAAAATDNPPGPPPITQMSGVSVSAMPLQALLATLACKSHGGVSRARAPMAHRHRHQCEQTERDERPDQLGRQEVHRIESHVAIRAFRSDALMIRIFLCSDHAVQTGPRQRKNNRCRNNTERGRGDEWS